MHATITVKKTGMSLSVLLLDEALIKKDFENGNIKEGKELDEIVKNVFQKFLIDNSRKGVKVAQSIIQMLGGNPETMKEEMTVTITI